MSENYVSCKVSAPGKIILHGEHSVVYGKTALAASLGIRSTAKIEEEQHSDDPTLKIVLKKLDLEVVYTKQSLKAISNNIPLKEGVEVYEWRTPKSIDHAEYLKKIAYFFEERKETQPSAINIVIFLYCTLLNKDEDDSCMILTVDSELTIGAGTGSSASYAVCLAAVMMQYMKTKEPAHYYSTLLDKELSPEEVQAFDPKTFTPEEKNMICEWAFYAERIAHGNPSGIDNSTCTYGSLVEFKKGSDPVPHDISLRLKVLLVDSRVNRQTKDLVHKVMLLKEKCPDIVDAIMNALNEVALTALKVINKINAIDVAKRNTAECRNYYDQMCELFDMNHQLLASLGVSHPALETIRNTSAEFGFSCKLTGAGGGGYAIVLIPPYSDDGNVNELMNSLNRGGFTVTLVELGGEGVIVA